MSGPPAHSWPCSLLPAGFLPCILPGPRLGSLCSDSVVRYLGEKNPPTVSHLSPHLLQPLPPTPSPVASVQPQDSQLMSAGDRAPPHPADETRGGKGHRNGCEFTPMYIHDGHPPRPPAHTPGVGTASWGWTPTCSLMAPAQTLKLSRRNPAVPESRRSQTPVCTAASAGTALFSSSLPG